MFGFGRRSPRKSPSQFAERPDPEKVAELRERLKELRGIPREERVAEWCRDTTQALLAQKDIFKGVKYKCSDNTVVGAHRFIFGMQSTYFLASLYRHGLTNVDKNCLMGKMYPFNGSSKCFMNIREFFYTGAIQELEEAPTLNSQMLNLDELLAASKGPRRDNLGELGGYLSRILCTKTSDSMTTAMWRLCLAYMYEMPEVIEAMKEQVADLPFTEECFKRCRHASAGVLAKILRDIPIPATELQVCSAVTSWAASEYTMDIDFDSDEEDSTDELLIPDMERGPILDEIDLTYVSSQDIKRVVAPMRLFDSDRLVQAQRKHAINRTGNLETRVNPKRGQ